MKKNSDEINKFYNKSHLTEISKGGYYKEKIAFVEENLSSFQNRKIRILDIACNDGKLTQIYSKYGSIMGIDINKQAVELCRKRGIKCLNSDVYGISKKYRNYYDIVIATDIIEHVFETDQFLGEIHKILKRNGMLILTTDNLASFGRRLMLLLGLNPFVEYSTELPFKELNVGHIRYYTVSNMRDQLQFMKFKNISIKGDIINLMPGLRLPYEVARHIPTFSRNMLVTARK